jgi:hypothetical protein
MAMIHEGEDSYALAAQEDRSAPRTRLSIPALLRPSGSKGFQTVVQDLSLSGFSAVAINRMHQGAVCWLTLPGLESQQAEVIWWDSGLAGCAFSQLLNPIVHENLLARWAGDSAIKLAS